MAMDKYLVKFYTKKSGSQLGLEIYAISEYHAEKEVLSRHPDAYSIFSENLSYKERQEENQRQEREERYRNKSTNPSEDDSGGFGIIVLTLFAVAAAIVYQIALYLMVVWEFLLYILIIVGFMVLIFKLKNNAKKASMVFAAIAIPFMIFRMTQLADDYKEHFANEEKLRLERAEQKAKESKKTQTHEKAVSKEQKPVKNTGSN